MELNTISKLVEEALSENEMLFIVELKMDKNNKVSLVLDGDEGIPLSECIRVNKFIENNLDKEEEDYSLEVSSPNIAEPIKNIRQYNKNLGRILKIKTETTKFEGKLVAIDNNDITLVWKTREPKPIGKGKVTVKKEATISFEDIIETKVKIIF